VRLQCRNPLRRPEINFHSFPPDAVDGGAPDLEALREGVEFVDQMLRTGQEQGTIAGHDFPGLNTFNGDVREWIKNTAWGHHACGTCRLGADEDPLAVVDSRFRVRGVSGLRVVDASIFPRIPGFFIVSSVYTIAEKAADAIAEDHPIPADGLTPEVKAERDRAPIWPSQPEFRARRTYPAVMEHAEAELIAGRRKAAGLR
jgi:choline dehydrogenase